MRKSKLIWAVAGGALLLTVVLVLLFAVGRRPFHALRAEEIATASVRLTPPDVTIPLDQAQIGELVGLLHDVRITRRDDSYTEYAGQGVIYTLTLRDGTEVTAMAYAPFFVIDGAGYRSAYAPCEALNAFGNRLLASTK